MSAKEVKALEKRVSALEAQVLELSKNNAGGARSKTSSNNVSNINQYLLHLLKTDPEAAYKLYPKSVIKKMNADPDVKNSGKPGTVKRVTKERTFLSKNSTEEVKKVLRSQLARFKEEQTANEHDDKTEESGSGSSKTKKDEKSKQGDKQKKPTKPAKEPASKKPAPKKGKQSKDDDSSSSADESDGSGPSSSSESGSGPSSSSESGSGSESSSSSSESEPGSESGSGSGSGDSSSSSAPPPPKKEKKSQKSRK